MKINKKILIMCVIIVVIIIVCICFKNKSKSVASNQNGNIANMGLVVSDGKYVYYNKYEKGIFKIDNGEEKQLTDETAYSMQILNDKIYYLTVKNFNNAVIKSVDINGDNLQEIYTIYTSISKMYVDNESIYFTSNKNESGIRKVDLNGKNEKTIIDGNIKDFQVVNNKVYYISDDNKVCRVTINGKDNKVLNNDLFIDKIQVVDDWIYYYNLKENALYRLDGNGQKNELISVLVKNESYNISDGYVYYFDVENSKIARMRIGKSNDCNDIVGINVLKTKINIAEGVVYYLDQSENKSQTYQMYRINVNGEQVDKIQY